jgi:protein-disulfide isomerase
MTTLKAPVTPHDHAVGAAQALVTLVEYGDYQCPHCAIAHPAVGKLLRHFGSNLRVVFRHFPLTEVHPQALPAAETAEFAGDHDRFWQMHDRLYENQPRLGQQLYLVLAARLGLPADRLPEALATGAHADRIQADFLGGVRSGVNGTPSFFINGLRHDEGFAFEALARAIQAAERVASIQSRRPSSRLADGPFP